MITGDILTYYSFAFSHLKCDKSKGEAPHKPVLLLSVLHEFAAGRISGNQVFITPELTRTFSNYWNALVTSIHGKKFTLPFYHLANEKGKYWHLQPMPGCEVWLGNAGSMQAFANLTAAVSCAVLDEKLTNLLLQKSSRQVLRDVLLETYFPGQQLPQVEDDSESYAQGLQNEVVSDNQAEYKAAMNKLRADKKARRLDPETYQIEVYNRGAVFRREVVKLYNETCCISGLRVSATFPVTMVDACHIKPFAVSFDNTLPNGIALCPNLHRAFDRGLLSVSDNYEVIFSDAFTENAASAFRLRLMEKVALVLPKNPLHQPSLAAFAWHRQNVFQQKQTV